MKGDKREFWYEEWGNEFVIIYICDIFYGIINVKMELIFMIIVKSVFFFKVWEGNFRINDV